jgi:hypothetical protein
VDDAIMVIWVECPPGCTAHPQHWTKGEAPVERLRPPRFPKLKFDSEGAYLQKEDGDYDDRH